MSQSPSRAHRSREIEESRKNGVFLEMWAGSGAGRRDGEDPKAGSDRELLPPPGTAGKRGGKNLGTAASRRGAPCRCGYRDGEGGVGNQLTLPAPPSHLGHKARGEGRRAGLEGQKHITHPDALQHLPLSYGRMCPQHTGHTMSHWPLMVVDNGSPGATDLKPETGLQQLSSIR